MTAPLRARLAGRLRAVAKALFPSVPPADQARVLAAMEGRDYQAPAAPPHAEAAPGWRADPANRWELDDTRLADLVDRWHREDRS